jgi:hypothetical protein
MGGDGDWKLLLRSRWLEGNLGQVGKGNLRECCIILKGLDWLDLVL